MSSIHENQSETKITRPNEMESILCGAKNYMKLFCWGLSCGRKLSWKKMGNIDGPKMLLEFSHRVEII